MDTVLGLFTSPLALTAAGVSGLLLLVHAARLAGRVPVAALGRGASAAEWLSLALALRAGLTGLCLGVWVVGVHLGAAALTVPAVVIGLEELYETTMVVRVLRARVAGRLA